MSKSNYVLQPTEDSHCNECGSQVWLLTPASQDLLQALVPGQGPPSFFICRACGFVGEVGVGPVTVDPEQTIRLHTEGQVYHLRIGGPELQQQRYQLLVWLEDVKDTEPKEAEILEGLINLTDAIADQAHDRYGIPCLLNQNEDEGSPG